MSSERRTAVFISSQAPSHEMAFSGTSTGGHPESEICRCEQAFERIKIARDLDISFSLYLDSLVSCLHSTLVACHGGSILGRGFFCMPSCSSGISGRSFWRSHAGLVS